jgi:hypothetical protein
MAPTPSLSLTLAPTAATGAPASAASRGRTGPGAPQVPQRATLRLAAALLLAGELLSLVVGAFHPDRESANDHPAVFAEYAASATWTAVHLGQFAGLTVVVAGLLALDVALRDRAGGRDWAARFGAAAAVAALALYGVLQAVDGVALKQAVDAWARASEAEKAARFASAETVRWLEWGTRSYQSVVFGLALLLLGAAVVRTARAPGAIGYLMGASGLAYLVQGWVLGAEGFSPRNGPPTLLGILLVLAWSVWLLVAAWRTPAPVRAMPR